MRNRETNTMLIAFNIHLCMTLYNIYVVYMLILHRQCTCNTINISHWWKNCGNPLYFNMISHYK